MNNGFVSDAKSLGQKEYKHGQVNVKAVAYNPSNGGGGGFKGSAPQNGGMSKEAQGESSGAFSRRRSAVDAALTVIAMAVVPALVFAVAL